MKKPIALPMNGTLPLRRKGFTLVELLIVIVIILVLSAIGFPLMKNMRARADKSQCMNRLHSWSIALGSYAADNNGKIAWKNWAPIGWDPASASPYLQYWTGGSVDLAGGVDAGSHATQLQMRHCPAMPKPAAGGNPSVDYAMIRPSPAVANQNDYPLASIKTPTHFLFMIEAKTNSGAPISSSGDITSQVKPLTVAGPNLRHDYTVNALLGDFSVRSMTWKDLAVGVTADYWTKLAP